MKKSILPLFLCFSFFLLITTQAFSQSAVLYTISANNVRAYVGTAGLLFNNWGTRGGFEAPKGPINNPQAKICLYGSTLWLGGIDPGNNLRVAAQTYRLMGNDFKSGPIDAVTGVSMPVADFDKMWRITTVDYQAAINRTSTVNLQNWPVSFTASGGKQPLAPFRDFNNDGVMDVLAGEYPIFPGDEALFFVYNDDTLHAESGGTKMGIEVKGFVYQYHRPQNEFLNNTVFVDYTITNRSGDEYKDFRAAAWTDFDLGDYADDRIGTDSARNLYYAYNGNDVDAGPLGYGNYPPAMAVQFFGAPLYAVMGYSNDISITGNPSFAADYYRYMNATWRDGSPLTHGGNGHNTGAPTRFMYNGDPCNNTGWTEPLAGVQAGDRRMLGTVDLGTMAPGAVKSFTVAYTWSQSQQGGAISSLCKLMAQTDSLKNWHASQPPLSAKQPATTATPKIYPNPAAEKIFIDTDKPVEAALFDIAGRQVATAHNNTFTVAGLATGMYVIRGTANGRAFTQKIMVQ